MQYTLEGFCPEDKSDGGAKLNTHLNLVLRLRINAAIPLLPVYMYISGVDRQFIFYFGSYLYL